MNYSYDRRLKEAKLKFQPGNKVEINTNHGFKPWHGDNGTIDKYVPFGKYYVNMDSGDRRMVDQDDLDPATRRQASQEDPKKLPVEVGSKLSLVRQAIYDHGTTHTPAERETTKIVSKVEWHEDRESYTVWLKGSTQSISVGPGPMVKIPKTFKLSVAQNGGVYLTGGNLKYLVTHLDGKPV